MSAALVACSSGSSSNNNPPPPTTTIAATSGSSQSATTGTAFANPLVATVTNGGSPVSGASVTFTAPASGASGTFGNGTATESDTTDASGVATSSAFTANSTAGAYTVSATVSGATTPASFSLTNNAATGPVLADGTYVFQLSGTYGTGTAVSPAAPSPYYAAGSFTVASGAITGGEQDFVDFLNNAHDSINPTGSAITSVNGNIQIVLTTCNATSCSSTDTKVGVAGVETLHASMGSATSGRIIEFDAAATASGTIDLQDPTAAQAAPAGPYIFGVQGWSQGKNPLAISGILNVSGTSISPTGTVFDLENNGNPFQAQTITAGTVAGPDNSGRVIFGFTASNTSFATINLVGYIVDGNRVRIVEGNDTFFATTGGTAYAQTGTLTITASTSFVVALTGADANGALQAAGVLTLNSSNVSGTISYNDLSPTVLQPAGSLTGTYVADGANAGRFTLNSVTDGKKTFTIELYVDGNGNALAMTLDTAQDILQGVAYQQASGPGFSGTYAMNATGTDKSANESELDAVGSITTGTNVFGATTGTGVDLNWISGSAGTVGVPAANLVVSGAFTNPSNGVSTGTGNTITGIDVTTAANADAFAYYVVDANRVVAIETDLNQLSLVLFEK
jgi:hypothetical protein